MAVEFLNFLYGEPIFQEQKDMFSHLFKKLENLKKRYLLINETWYDQATLENDIKDKVFDEVITFSFMDQPNLNFNFLNNFPVHKIGYYKNSPFYFDFHSFMVLKYLKIDNSIVLNDADNITTPFMCLNGKPHDHRFELVNNLLKYNLHQKNIISFNSIANTGLVLKVDDVKPQNITPGPFDVYSLGNMNNWKKHFLNVVTETLFNSEDYFFITEKTYKPILGLRPFIVHSTNANKNILKKFGFEPYIDDFSDITDLDLSNPATHHIFLKTLTEENKKYFKQKYIKLSEKISYNRNAFDKHVTQQVQNIRNIEKHFF